MNLNTAKNHLIGMTAMALVLTACGNSNTDETAEDTTQAEAKTTLVKEGQEPTAEQAALLDYLAVKDALVETDGSKAQKAADKLVTKLKKIDNAYAENAAENAHNIATTDAVEKQREFFNDLSQNIYAMLKTEKPVDATLYKQYCPMAFNNEGAFWVSAEKDILNPYFGDKMLKCGVVKEEL